MVENRELVLRRIFDNGDTTVGYMIEKGPHQAFIGYTCEDQKQIGPKIKGETRIPGNKRYRLTINKALTGKTEEYRKNYTWFKFHIMLMDVEGFAGIYIHIGNDDDDTDGCLLIGDKQSNISLTPAIAKPIENSTNCFKRFYQKYYPLLDAGVPVYLTIIDEEF